MKVAIVAFRFDQRGGSERRTYYLTKGLVERGHEVEVFAASIEDLDLDIKANRVHFFKGPSFMKVKSFSQNVERALASRGDFDVVHNQIRPFTDGIVTIGGGCHAEYLGHKGGRFGNFFNPLNRVVLKMERERYREGGSRGIIAISEFVKRGILRHYPFPPEKIYIAYNGVDHGRFNPSVAGYRDDIRSRHGLGDGPVLLFMGSGFRRKGLDTLIKAMPVIKGMDRDIKRLKVLVAGRDDPRPYMRLAGKLGVLDSVVFAGATREPEKYYGAADIFALPTTYEPFGNAFLEAMACGLPVITTSRAGAAEIISDGENGFVMDNPCNHTALAATIAYLSCEKARKEIGKNARTTAEGLTWDKTLDKTLEAYGTAGKNR